MQILNMAMTLLRRCRVNAALTIQLFSQLFHFVNMWLFNYVILQPKLQLCSRDWGARFHQRLTHVQAWAEQQGLELAADCHLAKVIQVCSVITDIIMQSSSYFFIALHFISFLVLYHIVLLYSALLFV